MKAPSSAQRCVAFLYVQMSTSRRPVGTSFLVHRSADDRRSSTTYLVTARHVIDNASREAADGLIWVRLNTRGGGTDWIETKIHDWLPHSKDETVDVSVLPLRPSFEKFEWAAIDIATALDDGTIARRGIGPGDELFFPGMFVSHRGQQRNVPIVRMGNIAAMPNPDEKVLTGIGLIDAYLVEARSIGGLSGSPVFVALDVVWQDDNGEWRGTGGQNYLLGLMHGHWTGTVTSADEADDWPGDPASEQVNMGIGVVVPVRYIVEAINQPKIAIAREAAERRLREGTAQATDLATGISVTGA
ncbi:MAG TPA: hypothetical protein VIK31_01705 [Propionibacteriaceae bacterium]